MIDEELAVIAEEIGERLFAFGRIEDIGLVELDPRELVPFGAQLVAGSGEDLLLSEERLARGKPVFPRYNFVLHGN